MYKRKTSVHFILLLENVFRLTDNEQAAIRQNHVSKLYVRYLDVILKDGKALPISPVVFKDSIPFNGKIKDCYDCDHEAPQQVKYSKLSFLKKMSEMKNHVGNPVRSNSIRWSLIHVTGTRISRQTSETT